MPHPEDEEDFENNLQLLESEEDDRSPLICIECKGSESYNDNQESGGLPHCITLISKKRWDFISKLVNDNKEHFDDDNDLYDLFKKSNVIEDLHPEVLIFIRKIKNNSFINTLMDAIMRLYRPERYDPHLYILKMKQQAPIRNILDIGVSDDYSGFSLDE